MIELAVHCLLEYNAYLPFVFSFFKDRFLC